jgi:hypothetical protein
MTTETKRKLNITPGEWRVGSSDADDYMGDMLPGGLYVQQCGSGRSVICEMDHCTENRAANARLIAAAPDLLEVCHRVVGMGAWTGPTPPGFNEAWEAAASAIARATATT